MRLILISLAILALSWSNIAHAKWQQASSDHFLIYADQSESDLRDFAEKLEKYHSAMELVSGQLYNQEASGPPSPSNRVTIFVVGAQRSVRKLAGKGSRYVAGFYRSRAGGSVAFVPRVRDGRGKEVSFSEIVLLHEYAHHFQLSNSRWRLPNWFTEGYAEYFASAAFERDGAVWVGRPAQHRAGELLNLRKVPLELLFDAKAYAAKKEKSSSYDSFYGRSWALFHYLTFARLNQDAERGDNIGRYINAIAKGENPVTAAQAAFGDFKKLDKELDRHIRSRMSALRLPPEWIKYGAITVTPLSEGAGKIMPIYQQSRNGVNREEALELVVEAREIAAQYPNDDFVQAALAEAEFDAGNNEEAIAAADRSIASNPENINAYIQKMYALFSIARKDEGSEEDNKAHWEAALASVTAANRVENDHPLPLIYYYSSFRDRGKEPTELAVQGLQQALGIAPYDDRTRGMLIGQMINEKRYDFARFYLNPLLSDPHNNGRGKRAEMLLARIERLENGETLESSSESETSFDGNGA